MAKITIKRRNESERADGRAALYAVVNIQREKIRIPLEIAVSWDEWDPISERVRGRSQSAKDSNLIISNTKARISDILVRARLTGDTLTKASFLAQFRRPEAPDNFISYCRRRLKLLGAALSYETRRHHESALRKLENYDSGLDFKDITTDFLRVYAAYLRDKYNNNPGTINKNICVIRMHYNAALRAGLVRDNPFEAYKVQHIRPVVIYLTEQELNTLIDLFKSDTLPDNEQDALRFFLFMTFTGMHITDARNLQIEQIIGGEIQYRRIKTGTAVAVPLSAPAAKLVYYYEGGRQRGKLFTSLPTDQAFNRLIKRVCQKAGIMKAVSAKAARHTFATLYYKKNAGDLGTLSKLLGHTSVTTTMIYAHILKENRVAGMAAFDGML